VPSAVRVVGAVLAAQLWIGIMDNTGAPDVWREAGGSQLMDWGWLAGLAYRHSRRAGSGGPRRIKSLGAGAGYSRRNPRKADAGRTTRTTDAGGTAGASHAGMKTAITDGDKACALKKATKRSKIMPSRAKQTLGRIKDSQRAGSPFGRLVRRITKLFGSEQHSPGGQPGY